MSDEQKKVQQSNIPQLGALELVDSEEANLKRCHWYHSWDESF